MIINNAFLYFHLSEKLILTFWGTNLRRSDVTTANENFADNGTSSKEASELLDMKALEEQRKIEDDVATKMALEETRGKDNRTCGKYGIQLLQTLNVCLRFQNLIVSPTRNRKT